MKYEKSAKRLRELREEQGLTQTELAEKVPCALRTYQNYESGSRLPVDGTLTQLSRLLDADPGYISGEQDYRNSYEKFQAAYPTDSSEKKGIGHLLDYLDFIGCDLLDSLLLMTEDQEKELYRYMAKQTKRSFNTFIRKNVDKPLVHKKVTPDDFDE